MAIVLNAHRCQPQAQTGLPMTCCTAVGEPSSHNGPASSFIELVTGTCQALHPQLPHCCRDSCSGAQPKPAARRRRAVWST